MKSGGHFCISDIVLNGKLTKKLQEAVELYAGCVSGAILKEEYLEIIKEIGFSTIEVKKLKKIEIPDTILLNFLTYDELNAFKKENVGIYSITVNGKKMSSAKKQIGFLKNTSRFGSHYVSLSALL